jgi:hypothetical protein
MNIGPCPHDSCPGLLTLAVPEETPAFTKVRCPVCQRWVWYRLSRLDPKAYTETAFADAYEVNEETRTITRRTT